MTSTRSILLLLVCISLAFVFLISLGFWQLQRLEWKEAMIARVEAGMKMPALPIAEVERLNRDGEDIEYRPAFAEGVFDHKLEQHYFATHQSRVGFFIYTPLTMDDGRVLFVNRGFVPMELKDPQKRRQGHIQGRVRIEGPARTAPSKRPNSAVPNNDLVKNVFHWKSLPQMVDRAFGQTRVNTASIFLDAGPGRAPGGWPVGGVTRVTFSNNHLQYAFTWFGLALALLGVGGYFLLGLIRGRNAP